MHPPGCLKPGALRHEVSRRKAEGRSDTKEVAELEIILAKLCPLHSGAVHLGAVRQFFLSHFGRLPSVANLQPHPTAGVEDPGGLICGTHLQKLNRRSLEVSSYLAASLTHSDRATDRKAPIPETTASRPRTPFGGRLAVTTPMNAEAGVRSTPQGEHSGFGLFESTCPPWESDGS